MDRIRKQRLAENEVIFREANRSVQDFIDDSAADNRRVTVKFYCECSHAECRERIEITAETYKETHQNKQSFIVLSGHEMLGLEKIVEYMDGFSVVEKLVKLPKPKEVSAALRKLEL